MTQEILQQAKSLDERLRAIKRTICELRDCNIVVCTKGSYLDELHVADFNLGKAASEALILILEAKQKEIEQKIEAL